MDTQVLYDLAKSLALFPGVLIVLLLLVVITMARWKLLARFLLLVSAVVLYAASTPVVGHALMRAVQTDFRPLDAAAIKGAGAIVLLSAGIDDHAPEYGGPAPGAMSLYRMRFAVHLHRRTGLPILVSGGKIRNAVLADTIAVALRDDYGIKAVWRETSSTNTRENAIHSAQILKAKKVDRVVLVTHAWHMPRAQEAFAREGIGTVPAATGYFGAEGKLTTRDFLPDFGALTATYYATHEYVGRLWYVVRG